MDDDALTLAEQYGGIWGEHPKYPVEDWQYEVTNDDTRSGYWEWVFSQLEDEKFNETDPLP